MNNNPTWPKVFAFFGLALMGLAVAVYSATVSTAGVTAWLAGKAMDGSELLSLGSAVIIAGMAAMAAFGYLGLRGFRSLTRR